MTVHFVGIGGIGMSALASYLLSKKEKVTGSDKALSPNILRLSQMGANIVLDHDQKDFSHVTCVVYSTAIDQQNNPEIVRAKKALIPVVHRSDFLNHLLQSSQPLLVTGAHGKTTTSALLSWVLQVAGKDPSFILGGLLKPKGENGYAGQGSYFVAEADESDGSFLKSDYFKAIITNFDIDHLYYWKSEENLQQAYKKFIEKAPSRDSLFMCSDDPFLASFSSYGITYGFADQADLQIHNYRPKGLRSVFDIFYNQKIYQDIELSLAGKHNVLNAAGVFGMALSLGLSYQDIYQGFKTFPGVHRRLDHKAHIADMDIFDDYAHHPQEIKKVLETMKETFPKKRVVAVFQPHRYSRLKHMMKEFVQSFMSADVAVMTDVYSAGESCLDGSFQQFMDQVQNQGIESIYLKKEDLVLKLKKLLKPKDVVLFLGAGDLFLISAQLIELMQKERK